MNPPDSNKILEYLEVLANTKITRSSMEGYHEYYEKAGSLGDRIRDMGKRATDGLILGLQSDNEEIRYNALVLISEIKDPRTIEPLRELSKTEHNQRNLTLISKTISKIYDPNRLNSLIKDLKSDDVEVRLDAVRKLGDYKNQAATALARTLQEDSNEAVRNAAATIIGMELTNSSQVVAPLMDMLQIEESSQVRANIVLALGANTTQVNIVVQALLTHALDETDNQVRNNILSALKSYPYPSAVPTLMENLKHPELESWITSTLAVYGKAGLLKDHMIDPAIEWVNTTLSTSDISSEQAKSLSDLSSALASVGSFKVIDPILKFIDVNIQPYSHYAIEHLGQIKDMNATVALESLLDNLDPELRLKALSVMSRNPSSSTIQAIQDFATRDNLSDAEQAIVQKFSVKGEVIEADPLQALKDDMQSNNVQTRIKALYELSKEEDGLPTLLEALKYDADSMVRSEVAERIGLRQMRNPDVIPYLIEAMNTDDKRAVRESAIKGLAYNKTNHEQISTAVLERIPEESVNTHDAILHALTKHPNSLAIPFAMESITNPTLSLKVVRLLKAYAQHDLITKDMIAPAIEWKNSLGDFESLDRSQQKAVTEFEELLAILDASD